jgi:plasmid stabilization system protein ParE
MVRVRFSEQAKADVREAIVNTIRGWGPHKAQEYRDLLREARSRLAREPHCGIAHPEIHPELRIYRRAELLEN